MEVTSPVYTVSYCTNSVLADLDETSNRHYLKFQNWGLEAFRRMNLANMVSNNIKTAKLDIDSATKTAPLPQDYVSYLKVGVSCGGYIINLDASDELKLELTDQLDPCDCLNELNQCQQIATQGVQGEPNWSGFPFYSSVWYYNSYYRNNQYNAGMYGVGAGHYRNAYRIDAAKCQIQFGITTPFDYVIMEYISNGMECGDAAIEETLIPYIKAYIHHRRCMLDPKINRLEAEMWKREWQREAKGVAARKAALTSWDWKQTWRRSITAMPKR
jgi:hypothetical protein